VHQAGSPQFDGVYRICGVNQGKLCYRKDDGVQTIIHYRGWWLMNENGTGDSAYGLRCPESDAMVPSDVAWGFKSGKAPAPAVRRIAQRAAGEESVALLAQATAEGVSCAASQKTSMDPAGSCVDVGAASAVSTVATCAGVSLPQSCGEDTVPHETQPCTLTEGDAFDEAGTGSPRGVAGEGVHERAERASSPLELAAADANHPAEQNHDDMPDATVQAPRAALEEIIEEDDAEAAPQEVSVKRVLDDSAAAGTCEPSHPARGLVSQRVSAFGQLSRTGTASPRKQPVGLCAESMPDAGIVSERIQQHQRFISLNSQHSRKIA
jgi:hypothetical protein